MGENGGNFPPGNMESRMRRLPASLGFAMAAILAGGLLACLPASTSASDNAVPKFSTFASADDLAAEVKLLVVDLEKAIVNEEEYKSQVEGRFIRDGNTITLLAIALGLHDQDSPLKPHANAVAAAARKLTETKDFATTKQAIADLEAAIGGQGGSELKWGKVAPLGSLMKDEVPNVNTKMKTGLRHFKTRAGEAAANAATVALIAENAMLYVADTKKPAEGVKWTEFAAQMRSAASEVAAKAHAGDEAGANVALDKLNESCTACHKVFNPEKQ
jgi:cytochrome c556